MEIIKRGQKPADRTYEGECSVCHTQVRFKQSEAKYTYDQRDGDFLLVQCPECRAQIIVDVKNYNR